MNEPMSHIFLFYIRTWPHKMNKTQQIFLHSKYFGADRTVFVQSKLLSKDEDIKIIDLQDVVSLGLDISVEDYPANLKAISNLTTIKQPNGDKEKKWQLLPYLYCSCCRKCYVWYSFSKVEVDGIVQYTRFAGANASTAKSHKCLKADQTSIHSFFGQKKDHKSDLSIQLSNADKNKLADGAAYLAAALPTVSLSALSFIVGFMGQIVNQIVCKNQSIRFRNYDFSISRPFIKSKLLSLANHEKKLASNNLEKLITNKSPLCLVLDHWSKNDRTWLGVVAKSLDCDLNNIYTPVMFKETDNKTSDGLIFDLNEILPENHDSKRLIYATNDNCNVMLSAFRNNKIYKKLHCFEHKFALVLKDFFETTLILRGVQNKLKDFASRNKFINS